MTQRNILALSAGITAFVLIFIAAVIGYSARPGATAAASDASSLVNSTPTPIAETVAYDPQAQTLVDQQIADYRQRLEQADQQLRQANAQLQEAYSKLNLLAASPTSSAASPDMPQPPPPAAPTAVVYPVSPEQAAAIALKLATGSTVTRTPELVSFRATVAYEVQLDSGLVYIDANTSQVLYNGTSPVSIEKPAPLLNVESGENGDNEGNGGGDD